VGGPTASQDRRRFVPVIVVTKTREESPVFHNDCSHYLPVIATPGDGDHRLRDENSHYQGVDETQRF
jgi:hypothetical protein